MKKAPEGASLIGDDLAPSRERLGYAKRYDAAMAKYDPLRDYLRNSGRQRVAMTFDQIAALVGPLPKSAYEYQAWWSNEVNPRTHVQKIGWQSAGYVVDRLSLPTRTVTFVKR